MRYLDNNDLDKTIQLFSFVGDENDNFHLCLELVDKLVVQMTCIISNKILCNNGTLVDNLHYQLGYYGLIDTEKL